MTAYALQQAGDVRALFTVCLWSEGQTKTLSKGERNYYSPKNNSHNHYNKDDEPVTFIQTVSPALDFEYWP